VSLLGVSAGTYTNVLYKNVSSDVAHRQFQSLVFQSRYRVRNNWSVNGHYTLQLQNDGNYEGEETNMPGDVSTIGDYPEAFPENRYYPDGRLQNFQRNRFRLWSVYNAGMGRAGDLSVSGLWRVEGARAYSLSIRNVATNATQKAILVNAGYPDAPTQTHLFFGDERGTESFPGYGLFDLDINYNVPVFKSLKPWIKLDIYNLFNNEKAIAYNTTLTQNTAAGVDAYGLATTFNKTANFGKATGNTQTNLGYTGINSFPRAFQDAPAGGRTIRVALGFRF
jgi:hypothetical protein